METNDLLVSEANVFSSPEPIDSYMTVPANGVGIDSRRQLYILDSLGREVHMGERRVRLTAREFNLLVYMIGRRGEIVSRREALRSVWGGAFGACSRTVDVHVQRLRKKLGESLWLDTVRGVGYRLR